MAANGNAERDWSALDACYQQPKRPNFPINCTIELRHPGLPDNGASNILFRFPAYDRNGGGLQHSIALTACAIVAGNKFAGYLSSTITGPPIAEALDAVLPNPYWPFPHNNLPAWWPTIPRGNFQTSSRAVSAISSRVRARDESCRLTGSSEETEVPHIIPVKEAAWFAQNDMSRYSYDNTSVDNSANLFVLRKDIHAAYDSFRWTIAPKTTSTASDSKWYFVYLDTPEEMGSLYHNVEMRPMLGVRSQYLLAGFSRAIFYLLLPFLNNYAPKRLIGESVGTKDPAGKEVGGVWAAEIFRLPGARGGNTSPQKGRSPKRQHTEDTAEPCNDPVSNRNPLPGPNLDSKRGRPSPDHDEPPPYSDNPQPSKQSKRNSYNPDDIPCTCDIETSPVAEQSISRCTEDPPDDLVVGDITCRSNNCRALAEFRHHQTVRAEALKLERTRSNVREWWEGQLEWARDCGLGNYRAYDKKHWFWVTGAEEHDNDGEYFDSNEGFGRM
ncbi:MAG: hypothetical protein Q9188_007168, partial [Gyalolechia gomerana]